MITVFDDLILYGKKYFVVSAKRITFLFFLFDFATKRDAETNLMLLPIIISRNRLIFKTNGDPSILITTHLGIAWL